MAKIAIITLSNEGLILAKQITGKISGDLFVHKVVKTDLITVNRFSKVIELTKNIFAKYQGLVYIMPSGVVVRALAPLIQSKHTDPAVIVMDILGRYAISLLSGHEGGANNLTLKISNITGAEPVITTTTEVSKKYIIGIGCKKGIAAITIHEGIKLALKQANISINNVRYLATIDIKAKEKGLLTVTEELQIPLRIISTAAINNTIYQFGNSEFVNKSIGVKGVAEPVALLAGRRTKLILPRMINQGVTVAIAQECSE